MNSSIIDLSYSASVEKYKFEAERLRDEVTRKDKLSTLDLKWTKVIIRLQNFDVQPDESMPKNLIYG
jgi:hypothetical protein